MLQANLGIFSYSELGEGAFDYHIFRKALKNPQKRDRPLRRGGVPLESENPLKIVTKTVFLGENAVFLLSSGGDFDFGNGYLDNDYRQKILDRILIEIMVNNGET